MTSEELALELFDKFAWSVEGGRTEPRPLLEAMIAFFDDHDQKIAGVMRESYADALNRARLNNWMSECNDDRKVALWMLEKVQELYQGSDYFMCACAVDMARILCDGEESEDTAQELLRGMGYLAKQMAAWKLTPETRAQVEQIPNVGSPF